MSELYSAAGLHDNARAHTHTEKDPLFPLSTERHTEPSCVSMTTLRIPQTSLRVSTAFPLPVCGDGGFSNHSTRQ